MAQAKPRNLNTVISKFYGGMSNDEYIGEADASGSPMCFLDGNSIDIHNNAKFVTLAWNVSNKTQFWVNGTHGIVTSVMQGTPGNMIAALSKGFLFNGTGTSVKTLSTEAMTTFIANGFCHVVKTNGKVDRWPYNPTDASLGVATSYVADYATLFATNFATTVPYLIDANYLYITDGSNKLYKADLSVAWYPTVTALTIDVGFFITAITYIWDRFIIYATGDGQGRQYLWTGSSQLTGGNLSKIIWYDKPILNVATLNNVDYVISGYPRRSALYLVNGLQPARLIQSKYSTDVVNQRFNFYPYYTNAIETFGEVVFIPAPGCVYAYGKNNPWLPTSCARRFTIPWQTETPTCLSLDGSSSNTMYAFYSIVGGNNYRVSMDISSSSTSLDPGTTIFNPIISDLYSNENSALKVRLGYDLPTSDCLVNVYKKVDYDGWFTNFYIQGGTMASFPSVGDIYTSGGHTYTVKSLTKKTVSDTCIIHCTDDITTVEIPQINNRTPWTLTKSSGAWPSSIAFYRSLVGMELAMVVDDITQHKELCDASDPSYQITFALDLVTFDSTKTPKVWDFVYAYSDIENDI